MMKQQSEGKDSSSEAMEEEDANSEEATAEETAPIKNLTVSGSPEKGHAGIKPGERIVPIWFATNRKADASGVYTTTRDPENNTYGRMDVEASIAQNHSLTKKQMQDTQWVKKKEEDFIGEISERLDVFRDLGCTPQILIALHNYNVDFTESLFQAAHWQEDCNVAGATISYSWPSLGKSGQYEHDTASLERSEPEIYDFLTKVSSLCGAENVHLVADGKACQGLIRVLERMALNQDELKIGQLFLLAPDVDRELFVDLSWLLPKFTNRTTLYASDSDRDALKSVKRHKAPRAGIFPPYTIADGVDTVAIAGFETDGLLVEKQTRSYEIVTLFYDMYDLMKSNAPPERRLHLIEQTDGGKTFWKLRKTLRSGSLW